MRMNRVAGLVAVCATLGMVQAAAAAGEQQETERVDRTVAFHDGGRLALKNFSGSITITGSSGPNVVIHAVRRATRDRLDRIHLDVAVDASEVTIDANKRDGDWEERNNNVVDTEFEIEVPRRTELDVNAFSSDIHIRDVSGRQHIKAFSGNLDVRDATGPFSLETFSGNIEVGLAPAAAGHVTFDSFSGQLTSDPPLTFQSSRRRHLEAQIGSSSDTELHFKTFSGDVRIK
jgi:DUF4097 and DUF4098 domain-containing protein YvlB